MSSKFFSLLRLIFSLAVASWAINWVLSSAGANLSNEFQNCRWGLVGVTVLLTAAGTAISSFRWATLLRLQQVYISQWDAFRLTMIGVFFNLFGLGGVGGDVFKMYYVRDHAGERKNEAMLSALVDRIIGLLGLFIVALASLPFVWNDLMSAPTQIKSCAGFVVLISLVGGLGVTLVLSRDFWLPPSTKEGIRKLATRFPEKLTRIIGKLVRSLDLYRTQLPQLFLALGLSTIVHTLATLAVYSLALAFQVQGLALRFCFIGVQVANTISAVPVTPGGLGSRDIVLKEFFLWGGAEPRCALIPFALSCIIVLWSVVGGIFFAAAKRAGEVPSDLGEEIKDEEIVG